MPRYDEIYERSGRYDKPSRWRPYSRWHRYSARTGTQNAPARYQTTERFLPRERYLPSERYLSRDRFLERGGYADDFGESRQNIDLCRQVRAIGAAFEHGRPAPKRRGVRAAVIDGAFLTAARSGTGAVL